MSPLAAVAQKALMIALSPALLAQQGWVDRGHDPQRPEALVIQGRVELSPAEAKQAARSSAEGQLRRQMERRGAALIEAKKPVWMPQLVADLTLERWGRGLDPTQAMTIVDHHVEPRDHGSYRSYQASLLVRNDDPKLEASLNRLGGTLKRDARLFVAKCGGTVALWSLLAVIFWWLDRLSRGYMTWRLRALFGGMGLLIPGIAFVLI